MGLTGILLNSQSPLLWYLLGFQSVLVWWGISSQSWYLDVLFLLIVLRMKGRTHVAPGPCYLGCFIRELMGPLENGPHPFFRMKVASYSWGSCLCLCVVLASNVRLRMIHLKSHLELFKQASIYIDELYIISILREPCGIGMCIQYAIQPIQILINKYV